LIVIHGNIHGIDHIHQKYSYNIHQFIPCEIFPCYSHGFFVECAQAQETPEVPATGPAYLGTRSRERNPARGLEDEGKPTKNGCFSELNC
jgi:hypothetical protein